MISNIYKTGILFIQSILFALSLSAQQVTVHGYVKDNSNSEALIGANVYVKGTATGAITYMYGFYSLTLKPGNVTLIYSFISKRKFVIEPYTGQ